MSKSRTILSTLLGEENTVILKFSWQGGTVPTAIMFFHSNRLGTEFENDLFVGTATGNLYHFDLTKDRTQLDLKGDLDDKVADIFEESESALVASNLGIITDLELGHDGYLYGTTYQENGSIFKNQFRPHF